MLVGHRNCSTWDSKGIDDDDDGDGSANVSVGFSNCIDDTILSFSYLKLTIVMSLIVSDDDGDDAAATAAVDDDDDDDGNL